MVNRLTPAEACAATGKKEVDVAIAVDPWKVPYFEKALDLENWEYTTTVGSSMSCIKVRVTNNPETVNKLAELVARVQKACLRKRRRLTLCLTALALFNKEG